MKFFNPADFNRPRRQELQRVHRDVDVAGRRHVSRRRVGKDGRRKDLEPAAGKSRRRQRRPHLQNRTSGKIQVPTEQFAGSKFSPLY